MNAAHPTPILGKVGTLVLATTWFSLLAGASGQPGSLRNREGLCLSIDRENTDPAIHVVLPGNGPEQGRSFNILLPEHLTVRAAGQTDAQHLYIFQPGRTGQPPHWRQTGNSLQYSETLSGIQFSAQATLQSDGILFRYKFTNRTPTSFDMVWAVTDPRFRTVFYDPRLERTWVHHAGGFDLLASETPERLTLPLDQWFPVRYHAQFTAPIPQQLVQHRADGITYRYKSRPVDIPLVATLSLDGKWIAASFAPNPGNVWSNPELTCQHVDPQVALPPAQTASYEVKLLLFRGTLDDALRKARQQLPELRQTPISTR